MAALADDTTRIFESTPGPEFTDGEVVASDIIYAGAVCVRNSSGYVKPHTGVASEAFAGFADHQADNSSGAAGDEEIRLRQRGVVRMAVVGVTGVTDEEKQVYASDDDIATLTSTTVNVSIGKIVRWVSGTTCLVYFEADALRSI